MKRLTSNLQVPVMIKCFFYIHLSNNNIFNFYNNLATIV